MHSLQTDDDRQTTTTLLARPLLKYGWLKMRLLNSQAQMHQWPH